MFDGSQWQAFFFGVREAQIRFRVRERVTLMIWLCSSHLTLRESCADRVVDITNRLKHESLEDRMYSQFARSRHSGGSTPACQKWEADHSSHEVRKVAHCPKLLSSLTKTGCITPEIAKRCKAMFGAYLPIAHKVFASREICRSTKLQLAHALLDGILFHGAATWPELSEGCSVRLEGYAAVSCARSLNISVGPDGAGWTDRQVRLECDVPRLEVVLPQSRLLPAARIARLRSELVESLAAG